MEREFIGSNQPLLRPTEALDPLIRADPARSTIKKRRNLRNRKKRIPRSLAMSDVRNNQTDNPLGSNTQLSSVGSDDSSTNTPIMSTSSYPATRKDFDFPSVVKGTGSGYFNGAEISRYLENFEDTCIDKGVHSYADRARYFRRWVEFDLRTVVTAELDKHSTWEAAAAALKKHWKYSDPKQTDDAYQTLIKFYRTPIGSDADNIMDALQRMDIFMSNLGADERAVAQLSATGDFMGKMDEFLQTAIRDRLNMSKATLRKMPWADFRAFLAEYAADGFQVGNRISRARTASPHQPTTIPPRLRSQSPAPRTSSNTKVKFDTTPSQSSTGTSASSKKADSSDQKFEKILEHVTGAMNNLSINILSSLNAMDRGRQQVIATRPITQGDDLDEDGLTSVFTGAQYSGYTPNPGGASGGVRRSSSREPAKKCYYCGAKDHTRDACADWARDQGCGIVHSCKGVYLGRISPDGSRSQYSLNPDHVQACMQYGKLRDYVWALIHRMGEEFPYWKEFQDRLAEYNKTNPSRVWVFDESMIQFPEQAINRGLIAIKPHDQRTEVRTSVQRVGSHDSAFEYIDKDDCTIHYTMISEGAEGQNWLQTTTHKVGKLYDPSTAAPSVLPPVGNSELDSEDEDASPSRTSSSSETLATNALGESSVRHSSRVKDHLKPAYTGPTPIKLPPIVPKKVAQRDHSSDRTEEKGPTRKVSKSSGTTDAVVQGLVEQFLQAKITVSPQQLFALHEDYTRAMRNALNSIDRANGRVYEYYGTSTQDSDQPGALREEAEEGIHTHVNLVQNEQRVPEEFPKPSGSSDQPKTRRYTAPAIFGVTKDGCLALAKGGAWATALNQGFTSLDLNQQNLLKTPLHIQTYEQQAEAGYVTRIYALPALWVHGGESEGPKWLAMLDSGSECNTCTMDFVKRHNLHVIATDATSQGLHGDKVRFVGETIATLYLAYKPIKVHFFVLSEPFSKTHDILLGMPFFADTSLTFDFTDDRLISANVVLGNRLIKCHVVTPSKVKRTKA